MPSRVVANLSIPPNRSRFRIKRNEMAIESADKQSIIQNRHTSVSRSESDCPDQHRHLSLPTPQRSASPKVKRSNLGWRFGDVHDAVDNDWRGLESGSSFNLIDPDRP